MDSLHGKEPVLYLGLTLELEEHQPAVHDSKEYLLGDGRNIHSLVPMLTKQGLKFFFYRNGNKFGPPVYAHIGEVIASERDATYALRERVLHKLDAVIGLADPKRLELHEGKYHTLPETINPSDLEVMAEKYS